MTIEHLMQDVKNKAIELDLVFRHGAENRVRTKVYNRYYLMTLLRKQKVTLKEIGEIFGLKHCTVVNGLKQAKNMRNDRLYLLMTDQLRLHFEQYAAINKPINQNNIAHDVLQCGSYWEMVKLQNDIRDGKYGELTA